MANENHQNCDICKIGNVSRVLQSIAFRQWTDKGYVSCRARVPMDVCDHCGARSLNEDAEQIIEQAVQDEYQKLP